MWGDKSQPGPCWALDSRRLKDAPEGHKWEGSKAIMKCWHFLVFILLGENKNDLQSLEYFKSQQRQKYNTLTTKFN